MFTVEFNDVTVPASANFDAFELAPADDKVLIVHAIYLAQSNPLATTDEEMLRARIIRGHTSSGNGTATTPVGVQSHGDTAGFTAKCGSTTIASGGTTKTVHSDAFNNRSGWAMVFPPELRPTIAQTQTYLVVRLASPDAAQRLSGTMYVEEIGG